MAPIDDTPWACNSGSMEYGGIIASVTTRIRIAVTRLEQTKSIDNGFMAAVFALRVLESTWRRGVPLISDTEVEFWERVYVDWVNSIRRFPKGTNRAKYLQAVHEEFARLKEVATPMAQHVWLPAVGSHLCDTISEEVGSEYYRLVLLKQDWSPCKFTVHTEASGSLLYSITFNEFASAAEHFEKHRLENNGLTWAKLLQVSLPKDVATNVTIGPANSSEVSVVSSMIAFLDAVCTHIQMLIRRQETFDQAAKKLSSEAGLE